MKETIKNYLDDFLVLPKAVKLFIFAVVGILVLFCAWQSFSNYRINQKVEDLEKMNVPAALSSCTFPTFHTPVG